MQAFFVGEVELIVAHPGPRHAPLAINSDHLTLRGREERRRNREAAHRSTAR